MFKPALFKKKPKDKKRGPIDPNDKRYEKSYKKLSDKMGKRY